MKQLLITLAFIILAVFIANKFILDDTSGMKAQITKIGDKMIEEIDAVTN